MKISKALQALLNEAQGSALNWVERAKVDFATALETQRRRAKLPYSEIARKLGTSPAYVSKVFRGDTNLTIETMVKLADATGGRIEITVVDMHAGLTKWPALNKPEKQVVATCAQGFTYVNTVANDGRFAVAA